MSSAVLDGLCVKCLAGLLSENGGPSPREEAGPVGGPALELLGLAAEDVGAVRASGDPERLGDYDLLEPIGHGGAGVVYRAWQRTARRIVALKTLALSVSLADVQALRRFQTETRIVARLDHPHIVPLYDVGRSGDRFYFAMKYLDGGTLREKGTAYAERPQAAARLVRILAEAAHYAHRRGVIHQDLKPGNILLDARGRPLIADFGIAICLYRPADAAAHAPIAGTLNYVAPELLSGGIHKPTILVDVWGLGTILYFLLTGRPPFRAEDPAETLRCIQGQDPESPSVLNSRVGLDLERICLKCLEKNPERRYASALALAEDLAR